ncbi:NADP-dependent oxidoreductase domain-containing protein [Gautieria morchelliformis]|nr:NADP-dependent oxidoreductase domain-containing protein [Gautieria morchelliformis]
MSATTKTLSNGVKIPWIAFGTGTALYTQDAEAATTLAIQSNFKHIDCAQMYENEDSSGKAIAKFPRESLFVTTKLAKLQPGETVRESLQGSLKRLGLQYVDLWLIHTPKQHTGTVKEVWKACEEVYKEGLTKSIGVSNFTVKDLQEILEVATVVPQVNQACTAYFWLIELHPYDYKVSKPLLELHKKHGIVTESYGGLAPLTTNPGGPLEPVLKTVREALEKRRGSPVTEGQVLQKWLQAKDIVIVTTSYKESRLKEYVDALNVPALTPEEEQAIDEAGSKVHYRRFVSQFPESTPSQRIGRAATHAGGCMLHVLPPR